MKTVKTNGHGTPRSILWASRGTWAAMLLLWSAFAVRGQTDPRLAEVFPGPIASDNESSWGCNWVDIDNDGDIDLSVFNGIAGGMVAESIALYRNDGGGNFTRLPPADMGTPFDHSAAWGYGTWGDLDNDGLADLVATGGDVVDPLRLLTPVSHNLGGGHFALWPEMSAFPDRTGHFALADVDNDGWLDLFIGTAHSSFLVDQNEIPASYRVRTNSLYLNVAGKGFVPVHAGALTQSVVNETQSAAWGDYDGDGDPDLVITLSLAGRVELYENLGRGSFRHALTSGLEVRIPSPLVAQWADYDNDGHLDLVVSSYGETSSLFHNDRGGRFTRRNIGQPRNNSLPAWGDYDNDGWLDLLITCENGENQLLHNRRDGTFAAVTEGSLVSTFSNSAGAAWGDYDNDGFLDIFVSQIGVNQLFHNDTNSNHWLKVDLRGTTSNRSAIGAKVKALATIQGRTFWQLRESTAGSRCQNDMRAHFGLGDATSVTALRIEWPSGTIQEFQNQPANRMLTIVEPRRPVLSGIKVSGAGTSGELTGDPDTKYQVMVTDELNSVASGWTTKLHVTTDTGGRAAWSDSGPPAQGRRFYRAQRVP